jgi:hypothetical protein
VPSAADLVGSTIVLLLVKKNQKHFHIILQTFKSEHKRYKEVYENLLEIILEVDALTKIYNVTKLGFLFDTAMSSRHGVKENLATGNLVKMFNLNENNVTDGHLVFSLYNSLLSLILA